MPDLPLPIEFRAEIIQPLVTLLLSGESGALVGVGSSGKSNVVRHLKRADVRARYFGEAQAATLVVTLNCKPHARNAPHEFYLYALDQLNRTIEEEGGPTPHVNDLWQEAAANPVLFAKRNLDRAIDRATRSGIEHLILLLDDCDDLLTHADAVLFTDLRELRDNHKYRVVYLTATRREPAFLRPAGHEFEDFFELLSADGHTLPMSPYTFPDAEFMLKRLAQRQTPPYLLIEAHIRRLFDLSGGHAGLLATLFFALRGGLDVMGDDVLRRLTANAQASDECQKILDSLEEDEQTDLRRMAHGAAPSADGLRRLEKRGLARPRVGRASEIFSPLFEQFLQTEVVTGPLAIDFTGPGSHVRVNGRAILLTRTEMELLRYLWKHQPQPCPIGELTAAMRTAETDERDEDKAKGKTPERLTQYMTRLKEKLGAAAQFVKNDALGYWLG
jgi:hypothetical protein